MVPERLQRDLAEHGVRVGVCRIKRIRQKLGIRCKQKRRFKTTTNSAHRLPVADNLLGQQFKVSQPNAVWVSDITYIPTDEGWLYLAGHKDLFTGELVGYAMGERMTRNLVSQSLFRALRAKRPARGLMHHSDRGSQYCSQEYSNLMERSGLRSSMSGKGNCFDNAPMESFWRTLKQELVLSQLGFGNCLRKRLRLLPFFRSVDVGGWQPWDENGMWSGWKGKNETSWND